MSQTFENVAWIVGGLAIIAVVLLASTGSANLGHSVPDESVSGESATRQTIRLALVWYFLASAVMLHLRANGWHAGSTPARTARWCWTWGVLVYLVHVTLAFVYFHHGSHAAAFEHTRVASGVGAGLYVNYLFTLVWMVDAASWWIAPVWHATRSVWLNRLIYGFILFIAFNGAVVYATGPVRWASAAGFGVLAALWIRKQIRGRTSLD